MRDAVLPSNPRLRGSGRRVSGFGLAGDGGGRLRRTKVAALAVVATLCAGALAAGTASGQEFQKTQLVDTTLNPMEIDVAPDGTVFYTERRGVVGVWDPTTESAREIATVPVTTFEENGLMGIALAPDYETSGWIYLSYSALPLESLTQRVSRFQLEEGTGDLDMDSEQPIFEWTHLRDTCCHSAGALEFDPDGNLLISTGDNTNPFESQGYAPIDERAGRESYDAQRFSSTSMGSPRRSTTSS
jgi:cytochrome c